jgi:hypothetical protein
MRVELHAWGNSLTSSTQVHNRTGPLPYAKQPATAGAATDFWAAAILPCRCYAVCYGGAFLHKLEFVFW